MGVKGRIEKCVLNNISACFGLLKHKVPVLSLWHIQGNSTVEEVRKMGSALARHTRGEEAEIIRHLIQRVSVILMKINSNLILNRSPNFSHPMIDGIE